MGKGKVVHVCANHMCIVVCVCVCVCMFVSVHDRDCVCTYFAGLPKAISSSCGVGGGDKERRKEGG